MRHRQQRWIDYTGLNLIRIVIGSYFMAIALGLITGISPPVLFLSMTDPVTADLIGTVLLFSITASFMLGLFLSLTSLMLAIFIFSSSVVQNFVLPEAALIEPFWRDLTLVCAVLLSYSCLKRNELSRAALVWRRATPRLKSNQTVVPRRIVTQDAEAERGQVPAHYRAVLKPLLQPKPDPDPARLRAPAPQPAPATAAARPRLVQAPPPLPEEPEIENIFAAL